MVAFFSPEAGFRRDNYKRAAEQLRSYEASSKGRRTGGWQTRGTSVNAEIGPALHIVRDRVRDQVRNNPHGAKAVSEIENAVVGTGIMATTNTPDKGKTQDRARGLWRDWSESTDCDADGMNNWYGLQSLAVRTIAEGGEVLIVRKRTRARKGAVPLQIQVLEGDFIDTSKEQLLDNGGYIRMGVEYDKSGKRVAYWLWNQHPGESLLLSLKQGLLSQRWPAEDVQHVFRFDRSGQVRGMSWGAPCVIRLNDLDAYADAQLLRQRIAASFAGFVRDIEMPDTIEAAKSVFGDKLEAGAIEILPAGKTIEFPNLPMVQNDGHQERVLRSIAAGWGVTYEGLTGDWSQVNYTSGRLGLIGFKRNVSKWQWLMFIPRVNAPVFRWFKEACELMGQDIAQAVQIYTPPRFEVVDPTKDYPAITGGIRSGLMTLPEAIREQGYDPEEHMAEIKRSNDDLDRQGIILDSDPRKVMKSGIMQQPTAEELSPDTPAPAAP